MLKQGHLKLRIAFILLITALAFPLILPLDKKINLGLDLKGGMYVLLQADTTGIQASKISDAMGGAIEKIRSRIDSFGVKETSIQIQGTNSILIQLPGIVDREIINKLREVGKLEFKLVEDDQEKIQAAFKGTIPEGYELKEYDKGRLLVRKEAALTGSDLGNSSIGFDSYGSPHVSLQFTGKGAEIFGKVTEENIGKQLAIILDNKVKSAPVIKTAIMTGQAIIEGNFTMDEARSVVSVLNSGALPLPLSVEEERTVGPLLGSDSIKKGINASILGIILVFGFMLIYYIAGGAIADICLIFNLIYTLAALSILKATLTLPGIAGMILTLGMAVDSNVLINERIRDELAAKKPLGIAIKNSFDRTFWTILDTHATMLIASLFLFIFGTGPIRGFATTLTVGTLLSIFSTLFIGKTIFVLFLNAGIKNLPMLQIFRSSKINFLKPRYICLTLSAILVAVGMFSFFSRKDGVYSIDFRGGQVLEYKITPPAAIEDVRNKLKDAGLPDLTIQDFKDIPGGINIISKEDVSNKVESALKANYKQVESLNITKVGPTVGALLKKKAIYAVVFSLMGILGYIFIRFKHFDFAMAGVIALLYDVLIALGAIAFFGYEVDLLIITALLTIAGYSISDTIVVYDRIREISPRLSKASLPEILNTALNQTFSRTIITSVTTFLVTLSLFLLAGRALHAFSFALLIGFISGVYSTIYISSALILIFRRARV